MNLCSKNKLLSSPWVRRKDIGGDSILVKHECETKGGRDYLERVREACPLFQRSTSSEKDALIWSLLRSNGSFYTKKWGDDDLWIKSDEDVVRARIRSILTEGRISPGGNEKRQNPSNIFGTNSRKPSCREAVALSPKPGAEDLHVSCISQDSILCGSETATVGGRSFLKLVHQLQPRFLSTTITVSQLGSMIRGVIRSSGTFYTASKTQHDTWVEASFFSICSMIVTVLSGESLNESQRLAYHHVPAGLTKESMGCSMAVKALSGDALNKCEGRPRSVTKELFTADNSVIPAPVPAKDASTLKKLEEVDSSSILFGKESATKRGQSFQTMIRILRPLFLVSNTPRDREAVVDSVLAYAESFFIPSTIHVDMWVKLDQPTVRSKIQALLSRASVSLPPEPESAIPSFALFMLKPKAGAKLIHGARISDKSILFGCEALTNGGEAYQSLVQRLRPLFETTPALRQDIVSLVVYSSGTFYMAAAESSDEMWVEVDPPSVRAKIYISLLENEAVCSPRADPPLSRKVLPRRDVNAAINGKTTAFHSKPVIHDHSVDVAQLGTCAHHDLESLQCTETGNRERIHTSNRGKRVQEAATPSECSARAGSPLCRKSLPGSDGNAAINGKTTALPSKPVIPGHGVDVERLGTRAHSELESLHCTDAENRERIHTASSSTDTETRERIHTPSRRNSTQETVTGNQAGFDMVAAMTLPDAEASLGDCETRDEGLQKRSHQDTVVSVGGQKRARRDAPLGDCAIPDAICDPLSAAATVVQPARLWNEETGCINDDEIDMYLWPCGEPGCLHWIKISQYAVGENKIPFVPCSTSSLVLGTPKEMRVHDQVTWPESLQHCLLEMVRSRRAHYRRRHPQILEADWPIAIRKVK
jgi:hypothetical protein